MDLKQLNAFIAVADLRSFSGLRPKQDCHSPV